jgi:HK97 family phage portal protein
MNLRFWQRPTLTELVQEQVRATLREPPDWMWEAFGGDRTYSGKSASIDSSLGLIPVFACVRLLAGTIGSLPLMVYERSSDGRARQRIETSNEWRILHDEPNSENAADVVWENVTGHLNLAGNCYLEKVKGAGLVGELWPISPGKVKPCRDSQGNKIFEIEGNQRSFTEDEIIHIPAFGYDGMRGMSPIAQARQELGASLAMQEFIGRFMANNATPAGVIEMPQGMDMEDDTRREAFKQQWNANYGSLRNSGGVAILEDGATWKSVSMPLKDIEFLATSKFTVNQVARLFQVPPEMIGGDRDSSMVYSTVELQSIHFVVYSLRRWLVRIEKSLYRHRDLFPNRNRYPEFLVEALLRGDSQARATFYKTLAEVEAIMVNEIRERENMPPLADGDKPPMVAGKAPQAADPNAQPPANGNGRDHLDAVELRQLVMDAARSAAPNIEFPEQKPSEVRFEEGAFKFDIHPPDVHFDEGSIRGGDVSVNPAPIQLELTIPNGGKRTVEFSDGRKAVIEDADDSQVTDG